MKDKRDTSIGTFVMGVLIGTGIGILFAPQSGDKSRAWLKQVKDENQEVIDNAVQTSESLISTSKTAIKEGFDKIADMIEDKLKEKKNKKEKQE